MSELQNNKRCKMFSFKYFLYDFTKVTASVPGLIWYRPHLLFENRKAKKPIRGGALLISNHCDYDDVIALQFGVWYRRHHFIAAQELFTGTLNKLLFNHFLCIPINRTNMSFGTFKTITQHLQNGELVTMFPEGHINQTSELEQFKSGAVLMALKGKKPIVPIYIKRRQHWYNRKVMVIGEPIDISNMFGKIPSLTDMNKVSSMLKEKEEYLRQLAENI